MRGGGGGGVARLERSEAVVLASRDAGEADREVVLLTRAHGKVVAQVRGARRVTSRLAGSLEPLATVDVMLFRGGRRTTVTGAAHAQPFRALRSDLGRFLAANVFAEALDALVPVGDVTDGLYALAVGGLEFLASEADADLALAFVLTKLLALLGYAPTWRTCAACGRPVEGGPYGLSAALGGVVAGPCAQGGAPLSPPALGALALLAEGRPAAVRRLHLAPGVRDEVRRAVWALVGQAAGRPLRSAPVYEAVAGATRPASTVRIDP
ncbi:MAG: DNA repair protein RecO [Firmicutes bacterium]|nr:DNA repair protein RecO [Bacillota bacterium]